MSIGLAILLSTALVLAVWLIDKHALWPRLIGPAKVLGLLAVLMLVTIVAAMLIRETLLSESISSALTEPDKDADVEKPVDEFVSRMLDSKNAIRNGDLDTYAGIRLGTSRTDIRYKWGNPSVADADDRIWQYGLSEFPNSRRYVLHFDSSGVVDSISCQGGNSFGSCDEIYPRDLAPADRVRVQTIGIGSPEADVLNRLGEPNWGKKPSDLRDDGTKFLKYGGSGKFTVTLELAKERVRKISLSRAPTGAPPDA